MRCHADRLRHKPSDHKLYVRGHSTITANQIQKTRDADVKKKVGCLKENLEYTTTCPIKGYHQQLENLSVKFLFIKG
jgi:hypothetical protein